MCMCACVRAQKAELVTAVEIMWMFGDIATRILNLHTI